MTVCCSSPSMETVIHHTERRRPHHKVLSSETRDECHNCGSVKWHHPDVTSKEFMAKHEARMKESAERRREFLQERHAP